MEYIGHVFTDEVVGLDGNTFVNCTFHGCTLEYHGGDTAIVETKFEATNRLKLAVGVDPKSNSILQTLASAVVSSGGTVASDTHPAMQRDAALED